MADKNKFPVNVDELLAYAKNNPTLQEIVSLLDQSNFLPQLETKPLNGVYGLYYPYSNNVVINEKQPEQTRPQTYTHELTHASDNLMYNQAFDYKWSEEHGGTLKQKEKQFKDGYYKLLPGNSTLLDSQKVKKDPYRYKDAELRAFGVGRHAHPEDKVEYPGTSHLDATMATEAAILRDLFIRSLNKKK